MRWFVMSLFTVFLALSPSTSPAQEIPLNTGQSIAFLGDSITQAGFESPTGYCNLVISGLRVNGIDLKPIPAGVGGNKSNDMLARLDRDVIAKHPDWVTVSCGVNDVWHSNGIPLEQYKVNMTNLVDRLQASSMHVMILTATMIEENADNDYNRRLAGYNAFLRELATQKHCLFADLNSDMQAQIKQEADAGRKAGHLLTMDGVHMNPRGNLMMASGILKAFSLSETQLTNARDVWMDTPDGWTAKVKYELTATKSLTLRQFLKVQQAMPKDDPAGVWDHLQASFRRDVESADGFEQFKAAAQQKFSQDVDERIGKQ